MNNIIIELNNEIKAVEPLLSEINDLTLEFKKSTMNMEGIHRKYSTFFLSKNNILF